MTTPDPNPQTEQHPDEPLAAGREAGARDDLMAELAARGGHQRPRSTRVLTAILLVTFGCLLGSCMTRTLNPSQCPPTPPAAATPAGAGSAP